MIAIKNLLFQPLTFQLAGAGRGLHLGPREGREISEEHVSAELKTAAKRGLISLAEVADRPEISPKGAPASKAKPKRKKTSTPRRPKRGGKP